MEFEPIKRDVLKKRKKERILVFVLTFLMIGVLGASSYAFFNYTRTGGNNTIKTGNIEFEFNDNNPSINIGNAFPIDAEELDNTYEGSFTITAYTSLTNGIGYRVYAIYGDAEETKTRLLDDVMSFQFIPATDGNGFTTTINNYSTAKSLVFQNGKALISTGLVKNTSDLTTKTYNYKLWIDSSKILISSTTKRATNAEGNPSLADTTAGRVTANRYIKNDSNLVETTLYPADSEHSGKIVYTTNEFKNSYYSIKIVVEAEEKGQNEDLVYFDANGGTVNTETKLVKVGEPYGLLPEPHRDGYTFLGWNGKNLLDEQSVFMAIQGATYENGYYVFGANMAYILYNGNISGNGFPLNNFDGAKQYTISFKGYGEDDRAFIIQATYSDESYTNKNLNSSIEQEVSFTTVSGKFINLIGVRYSNAPIVHLKYFQIEEGNTATTYEPFYVTSSVNVTQEKDHVLKAIWQKNS